MSEFLDRIAWLLDGGDPNVEPIVPFLRGMLLAASIAALTYLLVMLVTRWGDRNATGKSLVLSVLLHLCLALGWVTMDKTWKPDALEPRPEEKRISIRQIVETDESEKQDEPGNTPVWEQPPEAVPQELARLDRSPLEFEPLAGPERTPEPLTPPELDTPDIPARPEEPVATPELQRAAERDPRVAATVPMKIDDDTAEARPEVLVPSTSQRREVVQRDGTTEQMTVERESPLGSSERLSLDPQPKIDPAAIAALPDPASPIPRKADSPIVQRRAGPAPAPLPSDAPGAPDADSGEPSRDLASASPRFTRQRTRTVQPQEQGTPERFRPQLNPGTPNPSAERLMTSREGIRTDLPLDGPRPNAVRPNFDALRTRNSVQIPATYRLRSLASRKGTALKNGGTEASEQAVEGSLRWLALHQNIEGYWDSDGFTAHCPAGDRCRGAGGASKTDPQGEDRRGAGTGADAGVTGLSILAFLGAGYTHEEGQYADQIDRALHWLVRVQRDDGYLGNKATYFESMYCHAIAAYAMAEAYGMQSDPASNPMLREAIARAVAYILSKQNPDGGWRYRLGQQSDMSMFGWALMALKSAEIAGIEIPREPKQKMIAFLRDRSLGQSTGLAGYRKGDPPTPPMTAEALFCKQMLGIHRSNPASIEAAGFMAQSPPRLSEYNLYYWYYGTLAMYQFGGRPWQQWNEEMRDTLVSVQRTTGHAAGSWDPNDTWGGIGGRVYSTALATLCLEVYYRFLPLYQIGESFDPQ